MNPRQPTTRSGTRNEYPSHQPANWVSNLLLLRPWRPDKYSKAPTAKYQQAESDQYASYLKKFQTWQISCAILPL